MFDKVEKSENSIFDEEINVSGWDAITNVFNELYPKQKEPKHYGTIISYRLGGNDPLDGISIYDGGDYWHFITYGMSELYEKESENGDISGFGMEFTFKLAKADYEDEEAEISCLCGILQAIARLSYSNGEVFNAYEYLYTGQKEGIDIKQKSNITGFITISDPCLKTISTPNGSVAFVEFIGVTDTELVAIMNNEISVKDLYDILQSDVTTYFRQSVI